MGKKLKIKSKLNRSANSDWEIVDNVSQQGYRYDSPDLNNQYNIIPSSKITMTERNGKPLKKGKLLGIDNLGNQQVMYPGQDYEFPGSSVTEIPIRQDGGQSNVLPVDNTRIKRPLDVTPKKLYEIPSYYPASGRIEESMSPLDFIPLGTANTSYKLFNALYNNVYKPYNKVADAVNTFEVARDLTELQNGGQISDWEILPKAQDGGYTWSGLEAPKYNVKATENNNVRVSKSINKPLTREQLYWVNKEQELSKLWEKSYEEEERKKRINSSIEMQNKPWRERLTPQGLATETGAIGDKFRFSNTPNWFDDYLNPAAMIGDMASGLGRIPLNVQQGNYGQAALAVGMPLGVGALAGIGAQGTKQFVNNLVNPLAGTGEAFNNLGNKYLPNAYKLNPFAGKLNRYNRVVGQDAIEDITNTGLIRTNPQAGVMTGIGLRQTPYPSFGKGKPRQAYIDQTIQQGKTPYIISTDRPMATSTLGRHGKGSTMFPIDENYVPGSKNYLSQFPANEAKVFEGSPHWLKGYSEVKKPPISSVDDVGRGFKSEIDWSNWNKEIPENKALMQEYNTIEQQTKANGTWMKYSDGTPFTGTPEQFIQMNSKNVIGYSGGNLKYSENMYKQDLHRGAHQHIDDFANRDAEWATFLTDNKLNAESYATSDGLPKKYYHPDVDGSGEWVDGIYQLGFPQNLPKVVGNAEGRNWRLLNYDSKIAEGVKSPKIVKYHNEALRDAETLKHYGLKNVDNSKDYLSTDIYANYIKNSTNPEGIAQINNVKDQMGFATNIPTNTVYAIDANKVPLKSLRHNNGMFDMTNPNIYKGLAPIGIGTAIATQKQKNEPYKLGGSIKIKKSSDWEIMD